MYLQLADDSIKTADMGVLDYMLRVETPEGVKWVREDYLDDLPEYEFLDIVQSQPHLGGLIKKTLQRRAERKDEKSQSKTGKRESKTAIKLGRADVKSAKAEAIRGGTWKQGGGVIEGITGAVGSIFGNQQAQDEEQAKMAMFTGGMQLGVNKWYQNPLTLAAVIGGGILGVIVLTSLIKTRK